MTELERARLEINEIDKEMAKLFAARMEAARVIAAYKKENGLSVRDPAREEVLIAKNETYIKDPALVPYYRDFIRGTIDVSCAYQTALLREMRVAYCGAAGAFAYIAARRMYPTAELCAYVDFASAYEAVTAGEADCAVLPLENSYAGEVGAVMDLIFSGELQINQVIDVPIEHHLLACRGATPTTITRVVSHPQALMQCEGFLRANRCETQAYSNTALAAKYVSEQHDVTLAAIASAETAERYGLEILAKNIQDSRDNTTRFGAFSRASGKSAATVGRADENFLLVFTVQNESGSLAKALNIIGAHGYNLRSLRSRPMKDLRWNYFFYVEAEGNIHNENGKELLRELSAVCAKLRLVGSYDAENVIRRG